MPAAPTPNALFAILLAVFAMYLFTREDRPLESSCLLVLIVLLVWFEFAGIEYAGARLSARDVLAGFGNAALVTIMSLLVLARGLERTAALQPINHVLAGLWRVQPRAAFLLTLLTAASLSMFLNNTPVVAAVLPLLAAVSQRAKVSPSGILMPVGFATIIGGMATTIGTSTNLLVNSMASRLGAHEFSMFEFTAPVALVGGIGILYLWLIAPRLLPERGAPLEDTRPRVFNAGLRVSGKGYANGRTLAELLRRSDGKLRLQRIARGKLSLARLPSTVLREGDVLHVTDSAENLKAYEKRLGVTFVAASQPANRRSGGTVSGDLLAEVVVSRDSALYQRTLENTRLLSAYGLVPLALHRPDGGTRRSERDITTAVLGAGDIVLVQGEAAELDRLKNSGQVLVLDGRIPLPQAERAAIALGIVGAVVVLAATGLVPIAVASFAGVGLLLATRCLGWQDALAALDRRIVIVIVTSLGLGLAMLATGAAEYVATLYVALTGSLPLPVVLAGLLLIFALLTEIVTNNAVAVLGTSIAISIASQLGAPAEPFILAVIFGANMSYLTPVGYQTNLLVMSAGGYSFADFFRVGLPLQIIMWLGLALLLPVIYGL